MSGKFWDVFLQIIANSKLCYPVVVAIITKLLSITFYFSRLDQDGRLLLFITLPVHEETFVYI